MIIWLASYPKSGNTWVRSLISSYYYSKNSFQFSDLKNIPNFSVGNFISEPSMLKNNMDVVEQWLNVQKSITKKKRNTFFKTHNACVSINNNLFTNNDYSSGCIYIVRDPRNVITSYKNFENVSYGKILNQMTNREGVLFAHRDFETKFGFKGFEFIGSWADNYNTWVKNKLAIPVHLVKYENLVKNTIGELKKILEFIGKCQNLQNFKFDLEKAQKSIEDTSFDSLSKMENLEGFDEVSQREKDTKFFNMGERNNWNETLPKNIKEKIEEIFRNEMWELGYIV